MYPLMLKCLKTMGIPCWLNLKKGQELNSSDKIVVRVRQDNAGLTDLSEFSEGSIVKITYDGMIMESYPLK